MERTGVAKFKTSKRVAPIAAQPATKCIINGGVLCKFVVWFFKIRLVSWDSGALRIPATAYAQTLCTSAGEHQADRAKETGNPTRGLSHRTGILERNVDEQLELLVCTADAQKK